MLRGTKSVIVLGVGAAAPGSLLEALKADPNGNNRRVKHTFFRAIGMRERGGDLAAVAAPGVAKKFEPSAQRSLCSACASFLDLEILR